MGGNNILDTRTESQGEPFNAGLKSKQGACNTQEKKADTQQLQLRKWRKGT